MPIPTERVNPIAGPNIGQDTADVINDPRRLSWDIAAGLEAIGTARDERAIGKAIDVFDNMEKEYIAELIGADEQAATKAEGDVLDTEGRPLTPAAKDIMRQAGLLGLAEQQGFAKGGLIIRKEAYMMRALRENPLIADVLNEALQRQSGLGRGQSMATTYLEDRREAQTAEAGVGLKKMIDNGYRLGVNYEAYDNKADWARDVQKVAAVQNYINTLEREAKLDKEAIRKGGPIFAEQYNIYAKNFLTMNGMTTEQLANLDPAQFETVKAQFIGGSSAMLRQWHQRLAPNTDFTDFVAQFPEISQWQTRINEANDPTTMSQIFKAWEDTGTVKLISALGGPASYAASVYAFDLVKSGLALNKVTANNVAMKGDGVVRNLMRLPMPTKEDFEEKTPAWKAWVEGAFANPWNNIITGPTADNLPRVWEEGNAIIEQSLKYLADGKDLSDPATAMSFKGVTDMMLYASQSKELPPEALTRKLLTLTKDPAWRQYLLSLPGTMIRDRISKVADDYIKRELDGIRQDVDSKVRIKVMEADQKVNRNYSATQALTTGIGMATFGMGAPGSPAGIPIGVTYPFKDLAGLRLDTEYLTLKVDVDGKVKWMPNPDTPEQYQSETRSRAAQLNSKYSLLMTDLVAAKTNNTLWGNDFAPDPQTILRDMAGNLPENVNKTE